MTAAVGQHSTSSPFWQARARLEAQIQALIDLLDEIDAPDEDLEGQPDLYGGSADIDLEPSIDDEPHDDDDPAEEDGDEEPSLGSIEHDLIGPRIWVAGRGLYNPADQSVWADSDARDLELDFENELEADDGDGPETHGRGFLPKLCSETPRAVRRAA